MTRLTRRQSLKLAAAGTVALSLLALPARAATHQVSIQGFAFSPANLQVAVGDTVTFTNNDGAPHTATADAFDTGRLRRGESQSVTFNAGGSHSYRCRFHPSMRGAIQVG